MPLLLVARFVVKSLWLEQRLRLAEVSLERNLATSLESMV